VAPGLTELETDAPSGRTFHTGDVAVVRARWPRFLWNGPLDGVPSRREGEVLEVGRSALDGTLFGFASDFQTDVEVPSAAWTCRQLGDPEQLGAPCATHLHRIRVPDGSVFAFVPCVTPRCPAALLRAGSVERTSVDGLSEARLVSLRDRWAIVATSRWVRSPDWTGGRLVVMTVAPAFRRAVEIPTDEIDARGELVLNRLGNVVVEPWGIRFRGTQALIERRTGSVQSSRAVDEHYAVTAEGRFVRSR
jgi:hypothetical protein